MRTYLIARAKQEDTGKKGIDSIINLHYMGAAEYEFGIMPKALSRMRNSIKDYIYADIPIKHDLITVFCKESQKAEIKTYLEKLAAGSIRTKNGNYFDWFVNNLRKSDCMYVRDRVDFWWDLENDLMFWCKNVDFESKFKEKIKG